MLPIPRFTGSAYKEDDRWGWEFTVSLLGDDEGHSFGSKNTYPTREDAITALKAAIQDAIKHMAEEFPELGIQPENYIDMKTNRTRQWNKKDEH